MTIVKGSKKYKPRAPIGVYKRIVEGGYQVRLDFVDEFSFAIYLEKDSEQVTKTYLIKSNKRSKAYIHSRMPYAEFRSSLRKAIDAMHDDVFL